MKNWLKKLAASILRITAALLIVTGTLSLAYFLWQPGSTEVLGEYPDNAIWIGHGWLGADEWFERNHRRKEDFRSEEKISVLFRKLKENHISIVYPHLCPARISGEIAPCDETQTERFLDLASQYGIRVIPWIGGVLGESARIRDESWRKNFIRSAGELLKRHPRFAGVQINIEPLPDHSGAFLALLEELHEVTQGRILSVAAYPPPTKWQDNSNVHWSWIYHAAVSRVCDQMVVMMYDTSIPLEKFYIRQMTGWTKLLNMSVRGTFKVCPLILGVPAYDDANVSYHHPRVENLSSALRGISAADRRENVRGIAIYCEWEMNDEKWQTFRQFVR